MRRKRQVSPSSGAYIVGKGRPPLATRWKEGQSGNPKGRPQGVKNMITYWHEALSRKIEIREGVSVRKVTVREAIPLKATTLALKGDYKAISLAIAMESQIKVAHERANIPSITKGMTSQEAVEIYKRYLQADWN
jgi:Family of unknown function (DUF5681)